MPPHCPKCLTPMLHALDETRHESGTFAGRCPACSGFWIPAEVASVPASREVIERLDTGPQRAAADDPRTGQCPEGHGLLRRARVTFHDPYFLERCARCGGIWFDAGDWSRSAREGLLSDLSQVWSPAWRKQLSDQQSRDALELDLRRKLGEELFGLLHTLGDRLEPHPQRGVALAYLSERLKHPEDSESQD